MWILFWKMKDLFFSKLISFYFIMIMACLFPLNDLVKGYKMFSIVVFTYLGFW